MTHPCFDEFEDAHHNLSIKFGHRAIMQEIITSIMISTLSFRCLPRTDSKDPYLAIEALWAGSRHCSEEHHFGDVTLGQEM
jgi:hypothetical protein